MLITMPYDQATLATPRPSSPRLLLGGAFRNFLGNSPIWYKITILAFLVFNALCHWSLGEQSGTLLGWLLLGQFIFTLAMALKCYPLLPGACWPCRPLPSD